MNTVAPRASFGMLVSTLMTPGIDSLVRKAAFIRDPWPEFGWGELNEPGPQTEDSIERGFRGAAPVDHQWGRSESLDPDDVGDIADEGPGHRG